MKFHKICIIGDGLSGLTTALTLQNLSVTIDLFYRNKTFNNFKDKRTTAISESNYKFLLRHSGEKFRKIINPIKKVSLFYEDNNKFLNFFNFKEENKNMMYIFQNKNLKKLIVSTLKKNKKIKFKDLIIDKNVSKVSIIGVGMITTPGVTYRMFQTLANKGINILVISTSEIKISVLIVKKFVKKAVSALHKEFKLD